MSSSEVLRPAEAARRLGVPTRVVIEAMYEKKVPRVRLADGTLGISSDDLDIFQARRLSQEGIKIGRWKPPSGGDHLAGPAPGAEHLIPSQMARTAGHTLGVCV